MLLYWIKRHPDCPLGGSCPSGECVNEVGDVIYKPKKKKEERKGARAEAKDVLSKDKAPDAATDDKYICDSSKDLKWFMNLDSTLKSKKYRNAKSKK